MLEGTGRNHHFADLGAIEAQRKQTIDHSRRQTVLDDAQQIRLRCCRVDAEPIPNLCMCSTHLAHRLHYAIEGSAKCRATSLVESDCNCPLAVEGRLHGAIVRKSLDIRSWEAAQKLVRDREIQGKKHVVVSEAGDRFLADRESAELSVAMLGKYFYCTWHLYMTAAGEIKPTPVILFT
jgi:hypothetical protein